MARISLASMTRRQSSADKENAVQGISFTRRPSWRIVVMGPNKASALFTKSVIAYYQILIVWSMQNDRLLTFCKCMDLSSITNAVPHWILLWRGILSGLAIPAWIWSSCHFCQQLQLLSPPLSVHWPESLPDWADVAFSEVEFPRKKNLSSQCSFQHRGVFASCVMV